MGGSSDVLVEEGIDPAHRLIHVARHPVGFNVRRPLDEEQLFIGGAGGFLEGAFRHVARVRLGPRHHQQRLIDELHVALGIKVHQVEQATGGVAERRIGMGMGLPVVLVALAVQLERQLGYLFVGQVGIAGVAHLTRGDFSGAGIGGLLQALLHSGELRVLISVATHQPGVKHAEGRQGLEALVGLGRFQRITAAAANAKQADAFLVNAGVLAEVIRHAVNVLDAVCRFIDAAGHASAGPLVGGVRRDGDVALLCQALGIEARDLLLDPPVGVGNDHGRVGFGGIIVGRGIDIRGYLDAMQVIFHRVEVDPALDVFGDGPFIGQGKRILSVIGGLGGGGKACQRRQHHGTAVSIKKRGLLRA